MLDETMGPLVDCRFDAALWGNRPLARLLRRNILKGGGLMERMEAYREALKRRVCDVCLEQKDNGECGLEDDRLCALDLHLDYIVQAVRSVKSDRIADYAQAISNTACFNCPNQDEAGHCDFRSNWECALDSFAYLVVEAIEEVDARAAAG